MIAIIDYGMGNIASIKNMLHKVGEKEVITSNSPDEISKSDKIILPGVGAFDMGMQMLGQSNLIDALNAHVQNGKPILGICLGMQLLGKGSDEGTAQGLGYINFYCERIKPNDEHLLVPHMGWEYVKVENEDSPLVQNLPDDPRFYFVHSYHAVCKNKADVLITCDYGGTLVAAVQHGNVYGTQFHPEKSHKYGMKLLKNFVEMH